MENLVQFWTLDDHEAFVRKLIKGLRDSRGVSQAELSEELGYGSNIVYKWETGRNHVKWSELIDVAKVLDTGIESAFARYFTFKGDLYNLGAVFSHLFSDVSITQLAKFTRRQGKSFKRAIFEVNSLDASVVLFLMCFHFSKTIELIADVCNPWLPEDIAVEYRLREDFCRLIQEYPWLSVLRLYFRENSVATLDDATIAKIANALAQDHQAVQWALDQLREKMLLNFDAKAEEWRVYERDLFLVKSHKGSYRQNIYWSKKILKKLELALDTEAFEDSDTCLTITFSTSAENLQEVRTLIRNFSSQLRHTLNKHQGQNTELLVLSMNLADISNLPVSLAKKSTSEVSDK